MAKVEFDAIIYLPAEGKKKVIPLRKCNSPSMGDESIFYLHIKGQRYEIEISNQHYKEEEEWVHAFESIWNDNEKVNTLAHDTNFSDECYDQANAEHKDHMPSELYKKNEGDEALGNTYCRLITMITLTSILMIIEILVGIMCNSLAITTDGFQMLSDLASMCVGMHTLREEKKSWERKNGIDLSFIRVGALGAMINACILVALCFFVLLKAMRRVITPSQEDVNYLPVFYAGIGGLVLHMIGLCLFSAHGQCGRDGNRHGGHVYSAHKSIDGIGHRSVGGIGHENMSMYALFWDSLGDAIGSIGVIVGSSIYMWTDWHWRYLLDPAVSVFICIVIFFGSWRLMKRSSVVLLGQIPLYIDTNKMDAEFNELKNVNIDAFHIFMLAEKALMGFCYCDIPSVKHQEIDNIFHQIREVFSKHKVKFSIIEPNFSEQCRVEKKGRPLVKGIFSPDAFVSPNTTHFVRVLGRASFDRRSDISNSNSDSLPVSMQTRAMAENSSYIRLT